MAVTKEIVAIVGKYTDKQGQEKNRYCKLGVVMTTKGGGEMIKIESIPVGWDGFAYLNDPKPRDNQQSNQDDGGEIPF